MRVDVGTLVPVLAKDGMGEDASVGGRERAEEAAGVEALDGVLRVELERELVPHEFALEVGGLEDFFGGGGGDVGGGAGLALGRVGETVYTQRGISKGRGGESMATYIILLAVRGSR